MSGRKRVRSRSRRRNATPGGTFSNAETYPILGTDTSVSTDISHKTQNTLSSDGNNSHDFFPGFDLHSRDEQDNNKHMGDNLEKIKLEKTEVLEYGIKSISYFKDFFTDFVELPESASGSAEEASISTIRELQPRVFKAALGIVAKDFETIKSKLESKLTSLSELSTS